MKILRWVHPVWNFRQSIPTAGYGTLPVRRSGASQDRPKAQQLARTVQRDMAMRISGMVKAIRVCNGHQPIFR